LTEGNILRVRDQGGESETEAESRSQVEEEEGGRERKRGEQRGRLCLFW